jgi:hypothetical protein
MVRSGRWRGASQRHALASVTDGQGYSAGYTYLANSRLVSQIAFKQRKEKRVKKRVKLDLKQAR